MARLVAVHFWPVEKNEAFTTFSTAELKSASASTMVGFLPPISSWMRSRRLRCLAVQPVADLAGAGERDGLERLGVHQRLAQLTARARHEIDHALGAPASCRASTMRHALRGAADAGLRLPCCRRSARAPSSRPE